jgi:hypothetical protein
LGYNSDEENIQVPGKTLEYAARLVRRGFDPAKWPPLLAFVCVVLLAALLRPFTQRRVPGGWYPCVRGEVIPFTLCLLCIGLGWRSLRHGTLVRRLAIAVIVLAATAMACSIADGVLSSWGEPYSRLGFEW